MPKELVVAFYVREVAELATQPRINPNRDQQALFTSLRKHMFTEVRTAMEQFDVRRVNIDAGVLSLDAEVM